MLGRRLLYACALASAALFEIFYPSPLAHFTLLFVLFLPVPALLLSLPAMLGTSVHIAPEARTAERAEAARWRVKITNRSFLPLSRLKMTVSAAQLLTGAHSARRVVLKSPARCETLFYPADTARCGVLSCTLEHVWVYDCLGLFSLPRRSVRAELTVLPMWRDDAPVPAPGMPAAAPGGPAGRNSGGSPEDYDLRPYRTGDALRAVHWKLSSKRDELIVREGVQPQDTLWNLTFDHFGAPEVFERVLDRLYTVGSVLLARGQRMLVQWAEPSTGAVRCMAVSDEASFLAALDTLLRDPAPGTGHSICESLPDAGAGPDAALRIHIDAGEEDAPCQS